MEEMTATQFFNLLLHSGVDVGKASVQISDGTYGIPTQEYVLNTFPEFYKNKLAEMGLGNWETSWDCDEFAWQFYTMARWAHYATKKSMSEGLAVGVCYFRSGARAEDGTGGGHAINFAVIGASVDRHIIFIEPQYAAKGKPCVIELSDYEKKSIWFMNL